MEIEQTIVEQPPAARTDDDPNPYVGPRPLQASDTLYGRVRELHELGDLLIAERIVLLYSPSGAGKTSLINAGLVKRLREQEGFRVLPPLRVSLPGTERTEGHANRYVRSVAECLLADLSDEQCKTLVASAMPCLSDYLAQRPHREKDGPVDSRFELLIFDQFEEICTLDPTDVAAKKAFFEELGEALRSRSRWALFVIREDHLAEVETFGHLLPTALASRFRLNLLTIDQAKEAIAGPALEAGMPFPDAHVEQLAADLATVTLLGPAGPAETVGVSVEPVQLQVVCRRLWQSRIDGKPAQVIGTGEVDDALADFYDAALARVAQGQDEETPKDRQRRIRDWIERHLIVKPGIRNQILRGHQHTEALSDDCVGALVSEHLLRVDHRNGRDWIEITHDRMIAPILTSNERWRKEHLQLYQLRAELWDQNKRSPDMLLSQDDYDAALRWQEAHPGKPGAVEEAFLQASKAALAQRAAQVETERRNRFLRRAGTGSLLCFVLFLVAAVGVFWRQEKVTSIEKLNGEALALPQPQYRLTLEHAVQAHDLWQEIKARDPRELWRRAQAFLAAHTGLVGVPPPRPDPLLRNIHAAMLAGLVSVPPVRAYPQAGARDAGASAAGTGTGIGVAPPCSVRSPAAVRQLAFNPARPQLAAACADGTVALWQLDRPGQPVERFQAGPQAWSVAFNADGSLLAVGSQDGTRIWRMAAQGTGAPAFMAAIPSQPAPARAMAVAFGPGDRLAVAQDNGDVRVHDIYTRGLPALASSLQADRGGGVLTAITFMRNDKLAFGDWRGNLWVWSWGAPGAGAGGVGKIEILELAESGSVYAGGTGHNAGIADLAYHAASDQLAAAGWVRKKSDDSNAEGHSYIAVWRRASDDPQLADRDGTVGRETVSHALAFSPDGSMLAYSGGESRLLSFMASPARPVAKGAVTGAPVRFQERLFSVAFSPYPADGGHWLAVGDGEKISLIDLRRPGPLAARPLPLAAPFDARAGQYQAALSGDGRVAAVAVGHELKISRSGGSADYAPARAVSAGIGEAGGLAVSPRGEWVAAGSGADAVALFDGDGRERVRLPLAQCSGPGARPGGLQLAFRPNDGANRLAIAHGAGLCVAAPGAAGTAPVRLPSGAEIKALAYSPDGTRLAALEGDNVIRVHQEGRAAPLVFAAPVTRVTTLRFTPDRRYLAFGTDDADIWILDLEAARWRRLDQLHDTDIKSIHFGVNAGVGFMMSTDIDGRIMMWSHVGGTGYNRLGRVLSPKGSPDATALTDDGEVLLVGGASPRIYDLRMETLLALACANVDASRYASCPKAAR